MTRPSPAHPGRCTTSPAAPVVDIVIAIGAGVLAQATTKEAAYGAGAATILFAASAGAGPASTAICGAEQEARPDERVAGSR